METEVIAQQRYISTSKYKMLEERNQLPFLPLAVLSFAQKTVPMVMISCKKNIKHHRAVLYFGPKRCMIDGKKGEKKVGN